MVVCGQASWRASRVNGFLGLQPPRGSVFTGQTNPLTMSPTRRDTRCAALLALCCLPAATSAESLFSDNFDVDSSAQWSVFTSQADTAVLFGYDYSADGIPASPHGSGTTLGVKFTANMVGTSVAGDAAGLNIVPQGQNFTGDYTVKFDLWVNANGPFPGGGAGSTEYAAAGIGLAGNGALVWSGGAPAGTAWFAASGEGGGSQDYRAYAGGTLQPEGAVYLATGTATRDAGNAYYTTQFPGGQTAPASQTAAHAQQTGGLNPGTIGFAWREVEMSKVGEDVTWSIDGLPIAKLNATADGVSVTGNITVGYFDPFNSVSDNAALSFGIVDNVRVESATAIPEPTIATLGLFGLGAMMLARRRA